MRNRRGARLAVAALAGAAALLLLLVLHLLQRPIDVSPASPPMGNAASRPPEALQLATALDKKTAAQFQETVNRPLFNPSRKPVQRQKAEAGPPKEAGKLRLIGVMQLGPGPRRALIRFSGERTGRWLAEGAEHNGWKLSKVNAHSVVVQAGGRSQELKLLTRPRRLENSLGAKSRTDR